MSNSWVEVRKECDISPDGKQIPSKITLERSTNKIAGLNSKDFIDILVKLLGFAAIVFTISLQKNSDLDKFIQEKKYSSVFAIKDAYAQLSGTYTKIAFLDSVANSDSCINALNAAYYSCVNVLSQNSLFFQDEEFANLNVCFFNYKGLCKTPISEWKDYTDYLNIVNAKFRSQCGRIIGVNLFSPSYTFINVPGPLVSLNTKDFLDSNYKNWKNSGNEK